MSQPAPEPARPDAPEEILHGGAPGRSRLRLASRIAAVVALLALGAWLVTVLRYPSDRTPEGAYLRIAKAVNLGEPGAFFAYLETEAQHAAYTIIDYRKKARARVLSAYPEPERSRLAKEYEAEAAAPDGADLFGLHAERHGMVALLRRDLSGVARVDVQGVRATVETARGSRYAFRRRDNGIWGLTLFTAQLRASAERAARDFAIVEQAALDYERATKGGAPAGAAPGGAAPGASAGP